jgi:hypothetical protein
VWLPNVVPPRPPTVTKILGGDQKITLHWASNRETDLTEYRVYRAETADAAKDIRDMTLVKTVAAGPDPAARPASVSAVDHPVVGQRTYFYAVVAVDTAGNVSLPDAVREARAFDATPPTPPALAGEWVRVKADGTVVAYADPIPAGEVRVPAVRLTWAPADPTLRCLVQVRVSTATVFLGVSSWLVPGAVVFLYYPASTTVGLEFRLKVRNAAGNLNTTFAPVAVAPAP